MPFLHADVDFSITQECVWCPFCHAALCDNHSKVDGCDDDPKADSAQKISSHSLPDASDDLLVALDGALVYGAPLGFYLAPLQRESESVAADIPCEG